MGVNTVSVLEFSNTPSIFDLEEIFVALKQVINLSEGTRIYHRLSNTAGTSEGNFFMYSLKVGVEGLSIRDLVKEESDEVEDRQMSICLCKSLSNSGYEQSNNPGFVISLSLWGSSEEIITEFTKALVKLDFISQAWYYKNDCSEDDPILYE